MLNSYLVVGLNSQVYTLANYKSGASHGKENICEK